MVLFRTEVVMPGPGWVGRRLPVDAGGECRAAARREGGQGCGRTSSRGRPAEGSRPTVGGVLPCGGQTAVCVRPLRKAPKERVPGANAQAEPPAVVATPVAVMCIIGNLLSNVGREQ
jgi:xanthine/CO dehydrogenase XdhC/CoxF family maturation factor